MFMYLGFGPPVILMSQGSGSTLGFLQPEEAKHSCFVAETAPGSSLSISWNEAVPSTCFPRG